jgi:hypothetical protein
MRPQNVELHIEELVLHGFAPSDRDHIAEAIKHELIRLFADQGMPPSSTNSMERAQMEAGAFNVTPDCTAAAIGTQTAQAVYGGLSS